MTKFPYQAVIFDVDDTLLNNFPDPRQPGLHERSRLTAVHEVGHRHNIQALKTFTPEENYQAFLTAPAHTLDAAVWNILRITKIVASPEIEPTHPLLLEIVELKNHLHERVLRKYGQEVPGAGAFVRQLATRGLSEHLALATTAVFRDIEVFLDMSGLKPFFPRHRIISREQLVHPKPNPEVYNRAFAALKLPEAARSKTLVIEDDPRGIMSAKAAGLCTWAITTRYTRNQLAALAVPPDFIGQSFAEFERQLYLTDAGDGPHEKASSSFLR